MNIARPLAHAASVSERRTFSWHRLRPILSRVRVVGLLAGCALLFWQYDGAAGDWFFAAGIAASLLLWIARRPGLDLAWPQALVLIFVGLTAAATVFGGGSILPFLITGYLVALSLAMASVLREDPKRLRIVELGLIASGCIATFLTCLGYAARQFGWQPLELLSYDAFRGMGLFKDPNAAGAFVACTYPFAVAWAARGRFAVVLVPVMTAVFGLGVVFSFSREALLLFALAILGVFICLGITRRLRPLVSLGLVCLIAVLSAGALNRLPAYRGYEFLQAYDQNGRFVAWRFGIDMLRQAPLGTGAGSFERRSQERFDAAVNSLPTPLDTTNGVPPPAVDEAAGFHSSLASEPAVLQVTPGAVSEPVTFTFKNTGTRPWIRGVPGQEARLGIGEAGLVLEAGTSPVIARFAHIDDQSDGSVDVGWLGPDRIVAQTEAQVAPGAEGSFTFQIQAPRQAGTYKLHLRPIIDGVTWMDEQGTVLEINVTSTISSPTLYTPAATAAIGGDVTAPTAPSAYPIPGAAVRVSTSSQLVTALADPLPHDIVLANGIYDNSGPFYNAYGHRLYAAALGGAVLRAGLSQGANDGPGGGVVQGIAFDVSDPTKTLANSVVNIWGGGTGPQILDVTIDGHNVIASGIVALPLEHTVVKRVVVRDVTDYGVVALGAAGVENPISLEDLDVARVAHAVPGSSNGKAETCVWLANGATVRRAMIRSCGFAGIWTGAGNTGSVLEHIDIDGAPVGVYVEETASQVSVRYMHTGTLVSTGFLAAGLAARQPGQSPSPGDLVVVPSAHNTYLRVAAESGALGFMAFSAYLILMFWSLWTRRWRENWALNLAVGLVIFAGLGIDTLHWRTLWLYLAMAAAVVVRNPTPIGLPYKPSALRLPIVWRRAPKAQPSGPATLVRRVPAVETPPSVIAVPKQNALSETPVRGMDTFELRAQLLRRDIAKPERFDLARLLNRISEAEAVLKNAAARQLTKTAEASALALRAVSAAVDSGSRVAGRIVSRSAVASRAGVTKASGAWLRPLLRTGVRVLQSSPPTRERRRPDVRVVVLEPPQVDPAVTSVAEAPDANAFSEQASHDLERAESRLAAKQLTLGYDHPDVAAELHLIGAIHHDAGRYSDAVGFYTAALAIRERALGTDHPEVASTLEDLAAARREEGEESEADVLLARANQIREARRQTAPAALPGKDS